MTPPSETQAGFTWDLDTLYRGDKDPALLEDLEDAEVRSARFAEDYCGRVRKSDLSPSLLLAAIKEWEAVQQLVLKPHLYAYLRSAQDKRDPKRERLLDMVTERRREIDHRLSFFPVELSALSETSVLALAATQDLQPYRHVLYNFLLWKPHILNEREEGFLREKLYPERRRLRSSYDRLTASLTVAVRMEEETRSLTTVQVLACLRSPERAVRAQAFHGLLEELGDRGREFGGILRPLLRNHHQENRQRRLQSPEQKSLLINGVGPDVLDTMMNAVESRYKDARGYFRTKASLLGVDRLKTSDILAPTAFPRSSLSFSEACKLVRTSLGGYHPLFRALLDRWMAGRWIDATMGPGKLPGAFCKCFSPAQHPFVSVPYAGNTCDLLTLAHEIGHALHYRLASAQSFLNFDPPPVLAECSGTFFEILLVQDLLHQSGSPLKEQELRTAHMDSILTTVFRQHVITRFEKTLHSGSMESLSLTDICRRWWSENLALYGDSVEMHPRYQWGWSYIWHIFHKPFYCWSYVFGNLLAMVFYEIYREGGPHVLNDLIAIWSAGGSQAPLAMLKKMGLEPSAAWFWDYAFGYVDRLAAGIQRA
jgi:oligoendopeptidase F